MLQLYNLYSPRSTTDMWFELEMFSSGRVLNMIIFIFLLFFTLSYILS